jgi:hypothetical protein
MFSNSDGNFSLTGLYIGDIPTRNVPHFQLHSRSKSGTVNISKDRDSPSLSNFNGKSKVRGAVGNNDLVLWWSQWLLQVQFTFKFHKILEVDVI